MKLLALCLACVLSFWQPADVRTACPKRLVAPSYPIIARLADVQGDVRVTLQVSADGKVLTASAVAGHPMLRQEAERNARLWQFADSGSESRIEILYRFKLEGERVGYRPQAQVEFDLTTTVTVTTLPAAPLPSHSHK